MSYLFVGAGQAGGAIIDAIFGQRDETLLGTAARKVGGLPFGLLEDESITSLADPLVINSTERDLQNLGNIRLDNQFGIARDPGLIERREDGFETQVTGGFGRDPVEANEVMKNHKSGLIELIESGDLRYGGTASKEEDPINFALIVFALGGGTGCGIAPHIADAIDEITDGTAPVIALCVLPNTGRDESGVEEDESGISAGRQAWNARYGLDQIESEVDGIVLIDNGRISYRAAAQSQFSEYNQYVAGAVFDLIMGPMIGGVDPSNYEDIDTPDIDIKDLATSVKFGVGRSRHKPGYAAIGQSTAMTRSFAGYLLPKLGYKEIDSAELSRLATTKQTVAGVDPSDAHKAISLVRSPAEYIREGGHRVRTDVVREHLQGQCGIEEVNIGIALQRRNLASVTTLLTYRREDVRRIDEIEETAEAYEEETQALVT
jgi:cell division GTPase FtsZ